MIVILGLILLVVAAVVAIAGVFTNLGSAHALTHAFTVFGHHMTGSTGALFLYGIIVGAVAMLGLGLLLTGARRTSRRGIVARHGLKQSRRETAAVGRERDEMTEQRDTARAESAAVGKDRDEMTEQRDTARAESAAVGKDRDDLTVQRDDPRAGQSQHARIQPASTSGHDTRGHDTSAPHSNADGDRDGDGHDGHRRLHLFGRHPAHH